MANICHLGCVGCLKSGLWARLVDYCHLQLKEAKP